MRELAFLNKGLTITLTDNRDGATHQDVFHYAGGITEFVQFLNEGKDLVDPAVIAFEGEKDKVIVDIAMQYQTGYSENMYTFVNDINTVEGACTWPASAPPSPECSMTMPERAAS